MSDNMTEKSNFSQVKELGGYTLLHPLGIGGMGEVYLATRNSDHTKVAIKILLPSLANNHYHIELFLKEINLLSRIKHPGIVHALEAGVQDDICFFVMNFIDGRNLVSVIEEDQPVNETAALVIIRDAAMILRDVYDQYQIIHRDIKPENIMITPKGQVHVLDFGLSWGIYDEHGRNCAGIGTAHFAAPEQQAGKNIDFRADIYALGATLFQLLTGHYPFEYPTVEEIKQAHLHNPLPDPQELRPGLGDGSAMILRKSLEKDPAFRYQSWQEMIDDLNATLKELKKHNKYILKPHQAAVIALLFVTVFGSLTFYHRGRKEQARRQEFINTMIEIENRSLQDPEDAMLLLDGVSEELAARYPEITDETRAFIARQLETKSREVDLALENELKRLRANSYQLQAEEQWYDAREFWHAQMKKNEYRNHEKFLEEAAKHLALINSKISTN